MLWEPICKLRSTLRVIASALVLIFSAGSTHAFEVVPANPTTDDSVKIVLEGAFTNTCEELGHWGFSHGNMSVSGYVSFIDHSDTAIECLEDYRPIEIVYEMGRLRAGTWHVAIMTEYIVPGGPPYQHGDFFMDFVVETPTEVGSASERSLPIEASLHQNYPNPFNSATCIKFDLTRAADVSVDVYNVLGQCVQTLVDERLSTGQYTVTWDGTTATGVSVASGVYFYRLTTDAFADTKKMVLLR